MALRSACIRSHFGSKPNLVGNMLFNVVAVCISLIMWILIGAYADGELRQALDVRPGAIGRNRWFLPRTTWFQQRLAAAPKEMPTLGRASLLVKLGPGQFGFGVLTPWTPEEEFLWEHFARPLDFYTFTILSAFHIKDAPRASAGMRTARHWQIVGYTGPADLLACEFSQVL